MVSGRGHQAPPAEAWASAIRADPIPVLRISEKIDLYEEEHHQVAPVEVVIALATDQGLHPSPEQAQELLDMRKEWREHKALPEPGG